MKNQSGNALFLILIAVILFAALSYAVTQSNRSGGDVSRESSLIAGTSVVNYFDGIGTAVTRMILRGAVLADIDFTPPDDPSFSTAPVTNKVFHPNGGGVPWQNIDPNIVIDPVNSYWNFYMVKIGGLGSDADDLVAAISGLKKGVCEQMNEKITGSKTIPESNSNVFTYWSTDTTQVGIGQASLCVHSSMEGYIYYHVLAEQ